MLLDMWRTSCVTNPASGAQPASHREQGYSLQGLSDEYSVYSKPDKPTVPRVLTREEIGEVLEQVQAERAFAKFR